MAMSTLVNLKMENFTDKEFILISMVKNIPVNLLRVEEMERECSSMQMATYTPVILKMENFTDKEFLPQLVVRNMLGNL